MTSRPFPAAPILALLAVGPVAIAINRFHSSQYVSGMNPAPGATTAHTDPLAIGLSCLLIVAVLATVALVVMLRRGK